MGMQLNYPWSVVPLSARYVPNLGPPPPNNRLTNDAARSYAQAFDDLVSAPTADAGILTTVGARPYPRTIGFPPLVVPEVRVTPGQRRAALLALLAALSCTLLTGDQADVRTRTRDRDEVLRFYHGTHDEHARTIITNGVQDGFTINQAMGNGFYTFRLEDLAEDWGITRTPIGKRPAVVRLTMQKSTYTTLQKQGLVDEGPWFAFPGASATPGITQVVFRPGSYAILNSAVVLKEWKERLYPSRTWSAYQATP
jgi:hypothetical protein